MDAYVQEQLEEAQRAKQQSFADKIMQERSENTYLSQDRYAASDDDLAKIKTDEDSFAKAEFLRKQQYRRDFQTLV